MHNFCFVMTLKAASFNIKEQKIVSQCCKYLIYRYYLYIYKNIIFTKQHIFCYNKVEQCRELTTFSVEVNKAVGNLKVKHIKGF